MAWRLTLLSCVAVWACVNADDFSHRKKNLADWDYTTACTSSAVKGSSYDCYYAFEGTEGTGEDYEWLARWQDNRPWIELTFDMDYEVTDLYILHPCDLTDRAKKISVSFSDGSFQKRLIKCQRWICPNNCNKINWLHIPLTPTRTRSIRIELLKNCSPNDTDSFIGIRELRIEGF